MKIPQPTFDQSLHKSLSNYEVAKQLIVKLNVPYEYFRRVEDRAVLKSSLFSARIEGNILDETTFERSKDEQAKREIFNLIDAIEYIKHIPARTSITLESVKSVHKLIMKGLTMDAGYFRTEQNAIFDSSGNVRYLPPPPDIMREQLISLIEYCNKPSEFPIITALITHLMFERIHPFVDGNGRVGRLLITLTANAQGEQFPLVVPFERYLENNRAIYYRHLDTGTTDISGYLLFMLDALIDEFEILYKELGNIESRDTKPYLPLRQDEIFHIISDHPYITMDGIHRRFLGVPIRTLRYDIAQLAKKEFIHKIGTTKGSCYKRIGS